MSYVVLVLALVLVLVLVLSDVLLVVFTCFAPLRGEGTASTRIGIDTSTCASTRTGGLGCTRSGIQLLCAAPRESIASTSCGTGTSTSTRFGSIQLFCAAPGGKYC